MAGLKRKFAQKLESLVEEHGENVGDTPVERSPRKGPATGPGGMLAFQEEMNASNEELSALRERVQAFESSLQVLLLDPSSIVISKLANRHEASFSNPAFEALKTDIAASKGNVQPIKVRPISSTPGKYELVFGHRRHRACLELGLQVLAMIESVDDTELFLAMERENRAREDLSPYEQGLHYKRAIELKIFPSIRSLAQAVGVSHSLVSKAVAIAELPDVVISAYRSPLELQYRWGQELADSLRKDEKRVVTLATELAGQEVKPAGAVVTQILCNKQRKSVEKKTRKLGKNGEATLMTEEGAVTVQFPKGVLSAARISKLAKLIEDFVAE